MTDLIPAARSPPTALLVMDYQGGIVARVPEADQLLERAADTPSIWSGTGAGQIGYVRVAFEDEDFDFPRVEPDGGVGAGLGSPFHADSPSTAIDERVAPAAGDVVVRKTRVGAFSTTDLHDQLQDLGVDTLVLAGISTSGVVLSTVIEAHDLDYRVFVLADGCADTARGAYLPAREDLPASGRVITLADLEQLLPK